MESSDYFVAWAIYLLAAVALAVFVWRFLRQYVWRGLAYVLECLLLALLFTPWYVRPDQDFLAPAFMVFLMDSITLSPTEGVRALIPLVMAMLAGLLLALVLTLVHRFRRRV